MLTIYTRYVSKTLFYNTERMMKPVKFFTTAILAGLPALGWSYDSAFTLTFEQATGSEGFVDASQANTIFVAGENTPADAPAYSVPPNSATGYNNTKWLRIGANVSGFGVTVASYDGRAGGATTTAQDFTATVEMYINPTTGKRYQVGLFGRAGTESSPFQVFYSHNTPGNANGYGWRGTGTTASYDGFGAGAETVPKWVRFKIQLGGATGTVSVDRDLDGVYELVSPPIALSVTNSGKIGVLSVINDPDNGSATIPNQFAYSDNLTYTPIASVNDWSVY